MTPVNDVAFISNQEHKITRTPRVQPIANSDHGIRRLIRVRNSSANNECRPMEHYAKQQVNNSDPIASGGIMSTLKTRPSLRDISNQRDVEETLWWDSGREDFDKSIYIDKTGDSNSSVIRKDIPWYNSRNLDSDKTVYLDMAELSNETPTLSISKSCLLTLNTMQREIAAMREVLDDTERCVHDAKNIRMSAKSSARGETHPLVRKCTLEEYETAVRYDPNLVEDYEVISNSQPQEYCIEDSEEFRAINRNIAFNKLGHKRIQGMSELNSYAANGHPYLGMRPPFSHNGVGGTVQSRLRAGQITEPTQIIDNVAYNQNVQENDFKANAMKRKISTDLVSKTNAVGNNFIQCRDELITDDRFGPEQVEATKILPEHFFGGFQFLPMKELAEISTLLLEAVASITNGPLEDKKNCSNRSDLSKNKPRSSQYFSKGQLYDIPMVSCENSMPALDINTKYKYPREYVQEIRNISNSNGIYTSNPKSRSLPREPLNDISVASFPCEYIDDISTPLCSREILRSNTKQSRSLHGEQLFDTTARSLDNYTVASIPSGYSSHSRAGPIYTYSSGTSESSPEIRRSSTGTQLHRISAPSFGSSKVATESTEYLNCSNGSLDNKNWSNISGLSQNKPRSSQYFSKGQLYDIPMIYFQNSIPASDINTKYKYPREYVKKIRNTSYDNGISASSPKSRSLLREPLNDISVASFPCEYIEEISTPLYSREISRSNTKQSQSLHGEPLFNTTARSLSNYTAASIPSGYPPNSRAGPIYTYSSGISGSSPEIRRSSTGRQPHGISASSFESSKVVSAF